MADLALQRRQKHPTTIENNLLLREKSVLDAKSRPRGPKEGSRDPKRGPLGGPGEPPRAAQEDAQGAPGGPRGSPGEAKGRQEVENGHEGPRRGPRGPQESPRRGPGASRGPGQRGKDNRRQEQTRPAAGATKPRTPWPISNLLLVYSMHGPTLAY